MMRKLFLKSLSAASLLAVLTVLSVPAEAADIRCRVPFDFTVNGKTLPAGTYVVSNTQSALFVRGVSDGAVILTQGLQSKDTEAKLVFHKYAGDRYVLHQAWMGGGIGRELQQPRLERERTKTARNGETAVEFERVVVPAL